MSAELERLLVRIDADTAMLRRALAAGDKDVAGFSGNVNKRLSATEKRFASLGNELRGAFQGIGAAYAVRELAQLSDSYQNIQNRLGTVTGSAKQLAEVQRQLFEISQSTRSDLATNVELYARFAGAMKGTGNTAGELLAFTESLNKAVALSGATSAEAAGALLQLSQGMGAAALRGQELNSVIEQLPAVADVIADGMGVTRGELKKLGEQGVITGQKILDAFAKASDGIDESFAKTVPTIGQAINVLQNSLLDFAGELAKSSGIAAATTNGIVYLAKALDKLAAASKQAGIENLAKPLGGTADSAEEAKAAIELLQAQLRERPATLEWYEIEGVFGRTADSVDSLRKRLVELQMQFQALSAKDSELLPGLSNVAKNLPVNAINPKEQGSWDTSLDFSSVDAMAALEKQRAEALGNIGEVARLEYESELENFRRMLADKQISEQEFATARSQLSDVLAAKIKDNLGAETQAQREYFQEIRGLLENDLLDAFSEVLETGKFKAGEFFSRLATGFAEATMQALILKPIMDSLFSGAGGKGGGLGNLLSGIFAPARAAGGPGMKGQPYLVGERGPEIFAPNSSGRFINAGATAGAMAGGPTNVYNIDARGADIGVLERIQGALAASEARRREPVAAVGGYQRRFPNRGL